MVHVRTLYPLLAGVWREVNRLRTGIMGGSEMARTCMARRGARMRYLSSGGGEAALGVGAMMRERVTRRVKGCRAVVDRVPAVKIRGRTSVTQV